MRKFTLTPLSWIWRAASVVQMSRARAHARRLSTPVISVGALTMGGAGKTPLVAHLARQLRAAGMNPAILTRGYKRVSRESMVIVPRGESASVESTGDEAQIFIRRGDAHVGIGADRYAVGRQVERDLAPDVFLLDDGFQHVALHRDRDLVLVDARDPSAGGIFPAGRLREPLSALSRATEIILSGSGAPRLGVDAPVYRSRVVPVEWVDAASGSSLPLDALRGLRVAAFCGLGRPQSFWATLEEAGVETILRREFPDHHRYSAAALARLGSAEAYVTTEKDWINIAPACRPPVKLYWLRIEIEVENESALFASFLQAFRKHFRNEKN